MALDIPEFYRQARTQFAVRHKNSNQLLGYALLLPEVAVEDYEVRLVPWLEDDLNTDDTALAVHDKKSQPAGLHSSSFSDLNLNLSVSSEASSQNTTLTSQSAADVTIVPAGSHASLSQDKVPSSTPEQISSMSSPSSLPSHFAHSSSPTRASTISSLVDKPTISPSLSEMKMNLSEASEDPSQNTLLTSQSGRDAIDIKRENCSAKKTLSNQISENSNSNLGRRGEFQFNRNWRRTEWKRSTFLFFNIPQETTKSSLRRVILKKKIGVEFDIENILNGVATVTFMEDHKRVLFKLGEVKVGEVTLKVEIQEIERENKKVVSIRMSDKYSDFKYSLPPRSQKNGDREKDMLDTGTMGKDDQVTSDSKGVSDWSVEVEEEEKRAVRRTFSPSSGVTVSQEGEAKPVFASVDVREKYIVRNRPHKK